METVEIKRGGVIGVVKALPARFIKRDYGLQIRAAVDAQRVSAYADHIKEHGPMDPIVVFIENKDFEHTKRAAYADGCLLAADGFHRIPAYEMAGVEAYPVEIRYGGYADALWYSMLANGKHGAAMSNADKRRAAELAVNDKTLGKKTDAEIAKRIGVSATLVSEVRRGIRPVDKKPAAEPPTPSEKHGPEPDPVEIPVSGKRETESPAPRPATARERKPPAETRPTKKMFLKTIEDMVDHDVVDEGDILDLFKTKQGEYKFVAYAGGVTTLKVVGPSGRSTVEVPVVVKEFSIERVVLKFDGDGKIKLVEE